MDLFEEHTSHGIGLILLLSMPAVLLAAGIGLIVGILQAVTQVQEQTIAAAPKIVFVFLLIVLGGPLMMQILEEYLRESVQIGMEVVPREDKMILPPKPRMAYGETDAKGDFFKEKKRYPGQSKVKQMMETPSKAGQLGSNERSMNASASKPKPKAGVGEQIYMKRRAAGKLPPPPKPAE